IFSLLLFLISIFLTIQQSGFIWSLIRPMEFFQFPWRFLLLAVFSMSFAAGFILWYLEEKIKSQKIILVIFVLAASYLITYYKNFFVSEKIVTDPSENYTNNSSLKWYASSVSDEYMPKGFPVP